MEEASNWTPERRAADVLYDLAQQVEELEGLPERIVIQQASPSEFPIRIYMGNDQEYEGYVVRFAEE